MFTTHQRATLRALVDRIIPADDFPSGWDAGVGVYFDQQFAGDLRPFVSFYQASLDALEAEAHAMAGAAFTALDATTQDVLLSRVELGEVTTAWPIEPVVFFRTVVEHTAEGYYSDPGNGGNDDEIAWRMIGFGVRA